MNKKRTFIQGNIVFPLITGKRAIISHNSQTISTSPVVQILEVSEEKIIIETRNTIYCVAPVYSKEVDSYMADNTVYV